MCRVPWEGTKRTFQSLLPVPDDGVSHIHAYHNLPRRIKLQDASHIEVKMSASKEIVRGLAEAGLDSVAKADKPWSDFSEDSHSLKAFTGLYPE